MSEVFEPEVIRFDLPLPTSPHGAVDDGAQRPRTHRVEDRRAGAGSALHSPGIQIKDVKAADGVYMLQSCLGSGQPSHDRLGTHEGLNLQRFND